MRRPLLARAAPLASVAARITLTLACALGLWGRHAAQTVSGLSAVQSNGQVFLTWTESPTPDTSYRVYRSSAPIAQTADLAQAVYLGKVGPHSSRNLRTTALSGSTQHFRITELGPPLADETGLFVHTVQTNEPAWYAVTSHDVSSEDDAITPGLNATVEELLEVPERPQPVLQQTDGVLNDYVHWVSSHDTPFAPAMWFRSSEPFNLRVAYDPLAGDGARPVLLKLHFRDGNFQHEPFPTHPEAILVSPDDWFPQYPNCTYWFGINPGYPDVFAYPNHVNQDYTVRRVLFELEFAQTAFPADPERVYATGVSMGAVGSLFLSYAHPERFAAAHVVLSKFDFGCLENGCWFEPGAGFALWGSSLDNLPCSDGIPTFDRLDLGFLAQLEPELDRPFFTSLDGRNDEYFGWADHPPAYAALQSTRQPNVQLWDDGTHTGKSSTAGGVWAPIWFERFEEMWRYEIHQALPVFTNYELDSAAGNGDPLDGDAVGSINASIGWDTSLVIDEPDRVGFTCFLRGGEALDSASQPQADVDWTPRRLQQLAITAGQHLVYSNRRGSGALLIDERVVTADALGLVTVPAVELSVESNALELATIDFPAGPGGGPPVHLLATGPLALGTWVELCTFGTPGAPTWLALGVVPANIPIPGFEGALQIGDPWLVGFGLIGADGKRLKRFEIGPSSSDLVGVPFLFQALVGTTFTELAHVTLVP